jgi:hypothetical protein
MHGSDDTDVSSSSMVTTKEKKAVPSQSFFENISAHAKEDGKPVYFYYDSWQQTHHSTTDDQVPKFKIP